MSTVNSDIENFNHYVKVNVERLKASGEQTNDLMIILFKAYQVAPDGEFLVYVNTKREQYDDGYNISPEELMTSALNNFEILRKDNKWNTMPTEQEQIISLASVVEKLKDENLKLSKSFNTSPP